MLSAATGRPVAAAGSATGTSIGAAMLVSDAPTTAEAAPRPAPVNGAALRAYAAEWLATVGG